MESWLRYIFLIPVLLAAWLPAGLQASDRDGEVHGGLLEPQIERTEFDESLIDTEDFELSTYVGILSVEDFGANIVLGIKLAYHVNEDVFVQAVFGNSNAGETSFEVLSGGAPLLSDDERTLEYYHFNVGYNWLPGEAFVSDKTTFNSTFYIIGGIGNTRFAGDGRFTLNYGFGYRILFLDAFSLSADMRDYVFNMDVFGETKITHNLEYSVAMSWYF